MKNLTAYCVSKRKKVTIKKVKQVWKAKSSRGHFLYLLEGEAPGCDKSVWRAVGVEDAEKIAKEIGKPIKLRKSSGKKKAKKTRKVKKVATKPKKKTATKKRRR